MAVIQNGKTVGQEPNIKPNASGSNSAVDRLVSRPCTEGEWPCEMSTHLAGLEAENYRLKSLIADLKQWDIAQATGTILKTGKAMQMAIPRRLRKRMHAVLGD